MIVINWKYQQRFKYLGSVLTQDGKYDNDIRISIRQAKEAFAKLSKVQRN